MARPTSLSKRRSISMGKPGDMLLSLPAPDHEMSRPGNPSQRSVRERWNRGWVWAVGGSALVHAAMLATLAVLHKGGGAPAVELIAVELAAPLPALALEAAVPVGSPTVMDPTAIPQKDELPPLLPPPRAPAGDRDEVAARTVAPADADGRARAAPAPDQGDDVGHRPEHAYRHDRSTLRSRLADTATDAQAARLRT